jgi:hypothetical protein
MAKYVTLVNPANGHEFVVTERQAAGVYADFRPVAADEPEPKPATGSTKRTARKKD